MSLARVGAMMGKGDAMKNEICIDVEARLTVSKDTAEKCLRLLEMYVNDNKDVLIIGHRDESGAEHFELSKRPET